MYPPITSPQTITVLLFHLSKKQSEHLMYTATGLFTTLGWITETTDHCFGVLHSLYPACIYFLSRGIVIQVVFTVRESSMPSPCTQNLSGAAFSKRRIPSRYKPSHFWSATPRQIISTPLQLINKLPTGSSFHFDKWNYVSSILWSYFVWSG